MSIIQSILSPRAETSTLSRPAQWLIDYFGGEKSSAGVAVNTATAMGHATYFACIRNISEDIAKLPWDVYRKKQPRGRELLPDHPVSLLVESPNENMTWMTFIETMTQHALGWRAGRAEIVRRGNGAPVELHLLDPNTVTKEVSSRGDVRYVVRTPGFGDVILPQENVLDVHGLGYDGLTGYAMTCIARDEIGAALATANHRSRWFGNGAQPSGIVEVPEGFSAPAMENLRKSFKERHEGDENKGKTMMLEAGVTWKPTTVNAKDAMLIEALEWDVENICRRFRMPPQKVGHLKRAQGWSTVEQFNTDYVTDCLMPWMKRWEYELKRKLFSAREPDHYIKGDFRGLLRGDGAARAAMYQALFNIGMLSPNDGRELEDLEPIDGGDTYYVQGAMMPVDLLRKKLEADIEKSEADTEAVQNPPEPVAPKQLPAPEPGNMTIRVTAIASKHEALLARELDAIIKREGAKSNKDEKWWTDHADNVILAFSRVLSSLGTAIRPEDATDQTMHAFARDEAAGHVATSKAQTGTDEHRAARAASEIIQRAVAKVLQ